MKIYRCIAETGANIQEGLITDGRIVSRDRNDKIMRMATIMCVAAPRLLRFVAQGSAMVTSSILTPSDCDPRALAEFEDLVLEAGTVDPQGLTERIRDASRLLFLRESNGQLVGVGALKHPLLSYRSRVFAQAGAAVREDEYPVELGWIAVAKSHQRRGLWRRIVGQLISLAENENLFATTRADGRAIRVAADYGFKPAGKPYPSGRGYDLVLLLRNVEEKHSLGQ